MRSKWNWILLLLACHRASAATFPETFQDDAELTDVFFVDRANGWIVGDRGSVFSTRDGGSSWQRQTTPITSRLESVYFVDQQHGWIVGGDLTPYTHTSRGVLLRTRDGGQTWQEIDRHVVPWLLGVRFFDEKNGYAYGHSSPAYPSGIVTTRDGGSTWTASRGRVVGLCADASLGAGRRGLFIDFFGNIVRTDSGGDRRVVQQSEQDRFRRVLMTPSGRAIACGNTGLVRRSLDVGATWSTPRIHGEKMAANFNTIAVGRTRAWLAGSPGTSILRSDDGGSTWRTFATGQTAPLNSVHFVDDNFGWAVGAFGTVLFSGDGGESWRRQRGGDLRAAVLFVVDDLLEIPWDTVAKLAIAERYRIVLCSMDPGVTSGDGPPLVAKVQRAAAVAGVSHVVSLVDATPAELATQVRLWRPDVLVQNARRSSQLDARIQQAVQLAMAEKKIDRLEPWRIKKVVTAKRNLDSKASPVSDQLAIDVGKSVSEIACEANSYFQTRHQPPSPFDLWYEHPEGARTDATDLDRLIPLSASGMNRRPASRISTNLRELQQNAMSRRNIRAIMQHESQNDSQTSRLTQLLYGLEEHDRGILLFELACRAEREGNYGESAAILNHLASTMPRHTLAEAASLMLIQHYGSEEFELASRRKHINASVVPASFSFAIDNQKVHISPSRMQDSQVGPESDMSTKLAWMSEKLTANPKLFFLPSARFPIAAYQRKHQPGKPLVFFRQQKKNGTDFFWRSSASTELALADPTIPTTVPKAVCSLFATKPYLDGKFDDPCWRDTIPLLMSSADENAVTCRFGFDDEFLFLAATCRKVVGSASGQSRDASFDEFNHLRLMLDVDRDFSTFWQLAIDRQGRARASLMNGNAWNPKWYVATHEGAEAWSVEVAVPLAELARQSPVAGDTWRIGIQRRDSETRVVSWPASRVCRLRPKHFGLLEFSAKSIQEPVGQ